MQQYHVRVAQDDLVFSAAHFITYGGNVCERLHGHNFRVAAEVHGPLDENHYVIDFIALRDVLKELLLELDHRMLLPTGHPTIHVNESEDEVLVTFDRRRWIFPRSNCVLLPVANTTAELLARHLGLRLLDRIEAKTGFRPPLVKIEVDEGFGKSATCELGDE